MRPSVRPLWRLSVRRNEASLRLGPDLDRPRNSQLAQTKRHRRRRRPRLGRCEVKWADLEHHRRACRTLPGDGWSLDLGETAKNDEPRWHEFVAPFYQVACHSPWPNGSGRELDIDSIGQFEWSAFARRVTCCDAEPMARAELTPPLAFEHRLRAAHLHLHG